MRQTAFIMGTAVSLDILGCRDKVIFKQVFDRLAAIDNRFSPYKPSSELSRYRRGEIVQEALSPEMQAVIKGCNLTERQTDGFFSVHFSGKFNPTGYVKGWAIKEAGRLLKRSGQKTFCLSLGGDILASSEGPKIWQIGLVDPKNPSNIGGLVSIKNGAVATSGNYERGRHIFNPKTKEPADYWASISVVGPDILQADILATAIFAAGEEGLKLQEKKPAYRILAVPGEVVGSNLATRYAQVE